MENKHIMHLITKKTHSKQRMALKFGNTNNHVANHMSTTRSLAFAKLSFRISIYTSTPQVRCMHIAYTPKFAARPFIAIRNPTLKHMGYQVRAPSYFATKLNINLDLKPHMTRRHVPINPPNHLFKVLVRNTY